MRITKALDEVKGQTTAKRALEVAWVGGHDVLLWGPRGAGKTTLIEAFSEVNAIEMDTCACGNSYSIVMDCTCQPRMLARWENRFVRLAAKTDIVLEVPPVPVKEMQASYRGCTLAQVTARVVASKAFSALNASTKLDDVGQRVMEMAARRMSFTVGEYETIIRVARTIASMDQSVHLMGKHVAEAIQYKTLSRHIRIRMDKAA